MGLMDFFDGNAQNNASDVYNTDPNDQDHKSSFTHEAIGGAAAFEAMKAYENHCAQNGDPGSHAMAKEIAMGFAGAEVDKLVETKGLDLIDREEAKRQASQQVEQALQQSGQY